MTNIGVNIYEEGYLKYLDTFKWIITGKNTKKMEFLHFDFGGFETRTAPCICNEEGKLRFKSAKILF